MGLACLADLPPVHVQATFVIVQPGIEFICENKKKKQNFPKRNGGALFLFVPKKFMTLMMLLYSLFRYSSRH